MLIVILAIVLFSTLIVAIYNSMANQMQMALHTTYYNQAILIAHAIFQQLDAEYISGRRPFNTLFPAFGNTDFDLDTDAYSFDGDPDNAAIPIQEIVYTPFISAAYLDTFGGTPQGATVSPHIRLTCRVRVTTTDADGNDINLWLGDDGEDFNNDITEI